MSDNSVNFWLNTSADELFDSIDTNKDNSISRNELKRSLSANGIPTSERLLDSIFKFCDIDNDNAISREEFICFTNKQNKKLKEVFNTLDDNQSGYLTKSEVKFVISKLDPSYAECKIDSMISNLDLNNDGKIDFNEFMRFYHMIPINNIKMFFDFFSKEGIDIGDMITIPNERDDDPSDKKK
jgi:Ca2+-binding EF-hand superfamily protein